MSQPKFTQPTQGFPDTPLGRHHELLFKLNTLSELAAEVMAGTSGRFAATRTLADVTCTLLTELNHLRSLNDFPNFSAQAGPLEMYRKALAAEGPADAEDEEAGR
ncbi:MAG TPA: hypothetical protein VGO93_16755 [Candidatus Xenobia bacterium]|jgi:hypothetical protein